jgi:hypothetical protein
VESGLHLIATIDPYSTTMTSIPMIAIIASVLAAQPLPGNGTDRLACFLRTQSSKCRQEICSFGLRVHQGQSVRLFLNLKEALRT